MSARLQSSRASLSANARRHDNVATARPLVAHIIFSLDVGGLENGLINLLNHMPSRYRHVVICLSHFSDFRDRIQRGDVKVFALHKRPGKDFAVYIRLWRLLKRLRPDIVHTRNYGALDSNFIAALAGVSLRVHGEHGWDMTDLNGENLKYKLLRRGLSPLIQRHVTVSRDLGTWLTECVGIPERRVCAIHNGVDTDIFYPVSSCSFNWVREAGDEFSGDKYIIGTIGRMASVKDQLTLARAFIELMRQEPRLRERVRLVMIGDGPLREPSRALLAENGLAAASWLPGRRDDVADLLRGMNLFVLPSLNEGISNTILEAMATGLAVVATDVGGNPELVIDGKTGTLVPPSNPTALARAMARYIADPDAAATASRSARTRALDEFSLGSMVNAYTQLYDDLMETR
jgi:sugar transferase (PEP-CTERM/EpsH1 system associated)